MATIATHQAVVTTTTKGKVCVKMQVLSACAACEAHGSCGFAEAKDRIVEIDTRNWQDYQPGDDVTVTISSNLGLMAVLIAYVLPSVLILAVFAALYKMGVSELITALGTLAAVGVYGLMLYVCRGRLQKRFTFGIK